MWLDVFFNAVGWVCILVLCAAWLSIAWAIIHHKKIEAKQEMEWRDRRDAALWASTVRRDDERRGA